MKYKENYVYRIEWGDKLQFWTISLYQDEEMTDLDGFDIMERWDPIILKSHSEANRQAMNITEIGCIDDLPEWKL